MLGFHLCWFRMNKSWSILVTTTNGVNWVNWNQRWKRLTFGCVEEPWCLIDVSGGPIWMGWMSYVMQAGGRVCLHPLWMSTLHMQQMRTIIHFKTIHQFSIYKMEMLWRIFSIQCLVSCRYFQIDVILSFWMVKLT